jgi:hypothetical protein
LITLFLPINSAQIFGLNWHALSINNAYILRLNRCSLSIMHNCCVQSICYSVNNVNAVGFNRYCCYYYCIMSLIIAQIVELSRGVLLTDNGQILEICADMKQQICVL